ncbi:MAG: tetratricopeptide repeat protein [Chloroflexota bacterium]
MLEIRTLGDLTIVKDGENLQDVGSAKAKAILAYVALEGGTHSRRDLAAIFWPESSESHANTSLRVALSDLRKIAGEYVRISNKTVAINPDAQVSTDVLELEELLEQDNVSSAIDLYQGELLKGIEIHDSNEFEEWRRWENERIRLSLEDAIQAATLDEFQLGHYKNGQTLAHALLRLDPFNETAFQQLMVALALDNKRPAAIRQYHQCRDLLQDDLYLDPSEETIRLYRLVVEDDLDALSRLFKTKNNLPPPHTSFVGRVKETEVVTESLRNPSRRLITLAGLGGVGKTRLALEIARKVLGSFPDGVYFVPLESISSAEFIFPAIIDALEFNYDQITYQLDSKDRLLDLLGDKSILLVLDGFEHLVDRAGLLAETLQRTSSVQLLVTSRQRLNLSSEWVYQVKGLPIPSPDHGSTSMETGSALSLFVERSRQVDAGFALSEQNCKSAMRICQLVEGFPLGIELAAATTSTLECSEIAKEIEKDLGFLSSPMSDVKERHRSLVATFQHSWNRLDHSLQRALMKLSVFRGGFDSRAARKVTGVSVAQLSLLVDRSLLHKRASSRLGMHRMIRQLLDEELRQSPSDWNMVHESHCRYYTDFLTDRGSDLRGPRMVTVRDQVRKEKENIRVAVHWASLKWDVESTSEILADFLSFYAVHVWHEGTVAFDKIARSVQKETGAVDNPVYLKCRAFQAFFYSNLGMFAESEEISRECLEPLQKQGMHLELSVCLHNLGCNASFEGKFDRSVKLLEEAIILGRSHRFVLFPTFYLWLGYAYFLVGKYQDGMHALKTCYDLFHKEGDIWGTAFALSKMGLASDYMEQYSEAIEYHQQAMRMFIATGNIGGQAYSHHRMSIGAYLLGDYEAAYQLADDALQQFREIGHRWGTCACLCNLGFAELGTDKPDVALELFVDALRRASEYNLPLQTLYALAGIASVSLAKGDEAAALDMFDYVQLHPKTADIYLEIAKRCFADYKDRFTDKKMTEDEIVPLDKMVVRELKKYP